MHHGGEEEFQLAVAEAEGITIFDLHEPAVIFNVVEALDHSDGLGVADNAYVWICTHHLGNRAAVVRLHMIYDQIVNRASGGYRADVAQELAHLVDAYGIDKSELLASIHYIGIVTHAIGKRPKSFEKGCDTVVDPGVIYSVCDLFEIHSEIVIR